MAQYMEAAAACDMNVVQISPVSVDMLRIREAAARRDVTKAKGAWRPDAAEEGSPGDQPDCSAAKCPDCRRVAAAGRPKDGATPTVNCLVSLLSQVSQAEAAFAALPPALQNSIRRAVGQFEALVDSPDDTSSSSSCRSPARSAAAEPETSSPAEIEGAPVHRTRTIVRCGERRFTVSEGSEKATRWKAIQGRLAELKLETMLQTFSSEYAHPVYRVVLTGGPCAGKSTGMVMLREQLEQNGFNVFCVPEAATILIEGGAAACFNEGTEEALFRFQLALLETQMALEDAFRAIAAACTKQAVIICDRGSMDGRAFCTEKVWNRILEAGEWTTSELRDGRYDLVVHLVTAADGAADFYGYATNASRSETAEEAVAQDVKLQQMWNGFPSLRIIDNSSSFEEKMKRCAQPILELVGADRRPGSQKKYAVESPPAALPITTTESESDIHILRGSRPENTMKIIHRADGKSNTFTYRTTRLHKGKLFKVEKPLSRTAYDQLLEQVDPKIPEVRTKNLSFVYARQYFDYCIHTKSSTRTGPDVVVTVETNRDQHGVEQPVNLPDFLEACGLTDITLQPEMEVQKSSLLSIVNILRPSSPRRTDSDLSTATPRLVHSR
ncbi:TRPL translocation defect protein 14 [Diplonema papillatum]|nr:TRPL translocation defect protein 14 [Diplonema papillatum]